MATIQTGKVKYTAGPPKQTQYGERINVVVTLQDGSETKLWGNPGDPIQHLQKGQDVTLVEGKKGWELAQPAGASPAAPANGQPRPNGQAAPVNGYSKPAFKIPTKEIGEQMQKAAGYYARLHRMCFDAVCKVYRDDTGFLLPDHELTTVATTLFIELNRQYFAPNREPQPGEVPLPHPDEVMTKPAPAVPFPDGADAPPPGYAQPFNELDLPF